jgi:hypothetical protein
MERMERCPYDFTVYGTQSIRFYCACNAVYMTLLCMESQSIGFYCAWNASLYDFIVHGTQSINDFTVHRT